jgi:hypothetical protein
MKESKQFVYRYNGDEKSDEVEEDLDGELPVPEKGRPFLRNGKRWEVVHVLKENYGSAIPVYRVFVRDFPES